ncbi:MAG: hypothetical protein AAB215_02295, partial [Planctomycetota bacterium]
ARMIVFAIPTRPSRRTARRTLQAHPRLFEGFETADPSDRLAESDYAPPPDDHFNNAGHRKMAEFILETLRGGGK